MDDIWYNGDVYRDGEWKSVVQTKDFDYAVWCLSYSAYEGMSKRIIPTESSSRKLP